MSQQSPSQLSPPSSNPTITSTQPLSHPHITLKSLSIIKPFLTPPSCTKLTTSLILPHLTDDLRKLVRHIASKYSMTLFNDWDTFWNKQKQFAKAQTKKGRGIAPGEGVLIVCDQECMGKIAREMRVNPTLRVVLMVKNLEEFTVKEEDSFVLVTDDWKEVQEYMGSIKKRLVLTAKC